MEYLALSFLAGILTVLAPCILPLLPVVIGGSITHKDRKRPIIVTLSLAVSIIIFTLLLKASTLFIDIPEDFWKWFSATIVGLFGLSLIFPNLWPHILLFFKQKDREGIEAKSQKILFKFHDKEGFWPAVALGAALGPVFASCSPTYFLILGTVLPENFIVGLINLIVYALGLALVMFAIAYAGQRYIKTLNKAADPQGWFKRGLGILFLVVALGVGTGYDKKISDKLLENGLFNITNIEQNIINKKEGFDTKDNDELFNTFQAAPDIIGLEHWMNSEGYGSLQELKGKVILIDFWTYSCINCIRTLPYLTSWDERYRDDGLVILGIHAPEFAFERVPKNVAKAIEDYNIKYPVALDNNFKTWRNYNNRFWPAKYLIDQEGNIRYYHFGEGDYDKTEEAITTLLGIEKEGMEMRQQKKGSVRSPETYLGTKRRANFAGIDEDNLASNEWSVSGSWDEDTEKIFSEKLPASIKMTFSGKEANLVLDGNATGKVYINGKFSQNITIDEARLYNVYTGKDGEHEIMIIFSGEYIEAFAWTFG